MTKLRGPTADASSSISSFHLRQKQQQQQQEEKKLQFFSHRWCWVVGLWVVGLGLVFHGLVNLFGEGSPLNDLKISILQQEDVYSMSMSMPMFHGKIIDWNSTKTTNIQNNKDQCRFYLAPSSIPNAGLGLYTATDLQRGDEIAHPDICIQVIDMPRGTQLSSHTWSAGFSFGQFEANSPERRVRSSCEGFATIVNTYRNKNNMEYYPKLQTSNGGLHRDRDPGAGAITQYNGLKKIATRDIQAGSELTIDYGDPFPDEYGDPPRPVRSPQWLKVLGQCVDNLREGPSTIPGAGRGAFATRNLPQGTVVAPAPLMHFSHRQLFAKHFQDEAKEELIVNYCFQHHAADKAAAEASSSSSSLGSGLLFYPHGPMVQLINHAPTSTAAAASRRKSTTTTTTTSKKTANVKLAWSAPEFHHAQWLNLPLKKFRDGDFPTGLRMDFVATRDIEEGEEVLLDYGPEWQAAWDAHVQNWKRAREREEHEERRGGEEEDDNDDNDKANYNDNNYAYVDEWDPDNTQPLLTLQELKQSFSNINKQTQQQQQQQQRYPDNLVTICHANLPKSPTEPEEWVQPKKSIQLKMYYCHVLEKEKGVPSTSEKTKDKSSSSSSSAHNKYYKVQLYLNYDDHQDELLSLSAQEQKQQQQQQDDSPKKNNNNNNNFETSSNSYILTHVPRRAIRFKEKPYWSDQHLANAFRHPIGIPDDIYPPKWKEY